MHIIFVLVLRIYKPLEANDTGGMNIINLFNLISAATYSNFPRKCPGLISSNW